MNLDDFAVLVEVRDWEEQDKEPSEWLEHNLEEFFEDELDDLIRTATGDPDAPQKQPLEWDCDASALDDESADVIVNDIVMTQLGAHDVFSTYVEADGSDYDDVDELHEAVNQWALSWYEARLEQYKTMLEDKDKPEYQRVLDRLNHGDWDSLDELDDLKDELILSLQGVSPSTADTVLTRAVGYVDDWNKRPLKSELKSLTGDESSSNGKRNGTKQDRVNQVKKHLERDVHDSWVTHTKDVYVKIRVDGDVKVHLVSPDKASDFYALVSARWEDVTGDAPSKQDVKQVVNQVAHRRLHQANKGELPTRSMSSQMHARRPKDLERAEMFYYYAGDERDIVVDASGVRYKESRGYFRPSSELAPYKYHEDGVDKTINELVKPLMSLSAKQRYLIAPMIPAYFVPDANKPITHFRGPSGSGKSHTSKFLKLVLSPERRQVQKPLNQGGQIPGELQDLKTECRHFKTILVDNEKHVSGEAQDLLCSIVTGGTFKKRALYTDSGLVSYELHNHFILNYISLNYVQDDFANRSLIFDLDRLSKDERMLDSRWVELAQDRYSKVQSRAFEVLSQSLSMPEDERKALPDEPGLHMNDFYAWAIRCAKVMGYDAEKYAERLTEFKQKAEMASVEDSSLVSQLIRYIKERNQPLKGTATEIRDHLKNNFTTEPEDFPSSAQKLGSRLSNRLKTRLERGANITVEKSIRNGRTNYTIYDRDKHAAHVDDHVSDAQVWDAVDELDDGDGAPTQDVVERVEADEDAVEDKLDTLEQHGDIARIKPGRLTLLR